MRRLFVFGFVGLAAVLAASSVLTAQQGAPAAAAAAAARPPGTPPVGLAFWAYGIAPGTPLPGAAPAPARAGGPAPAPDPTLHQVPGSTFQFTRAQIQGNNGNGPADWFPGDHPMMPDVVAKGRGLDVRPCSLCHYPNGKGRPENAGVAGLPASYILQQLNDYRNDKRKSGEPRKNNTNIMVNIAKGMTEFEMRQAADYFSSMKWTPWIKVVETRTVAKTRVAGGMFLKVEGAETEPIGNRIIETPEFTERTEIMRDPRAGFIAYVPVGAVKKGEALVKTGGAGKTVACGACHGTDLQGIGPVPGLAGRSPSYIARQLYDMQSGARAGEWTELMKSVVAKLTDDDLVNIAAYVAAQPAAAPAAATR